MKTPAPVRRRAGFSLVELLVGMAIGLIAVLVIMQTMSAAEGQRRRATSGSDSGTAGAIALLSIQRDLQNAGFGMTIDAPAYPAAGPNSLLANCTTLATFNNTRATPAMTLAFAPLAIFREPGWGGYPAADDNTDIVQVAYGTSNFSFSRQGIQVVDAGGGTLNTLIASGFTTAGLRAGDFAVIRQGANCILTQIAAVNTVSQVARAAGTFNDGGDFNRGLSFTAGNPGILYSLGRTVNDAGQPAGAGFVVRAYAVRAGRLTACAPLYQDCTQLAEWTPQGDGVVSLRAQIGTNSDGDAAQAVDAWGTAAPAPPLLWRDVKAVRLALVARAQERERAAIDNADCTPSWAGDDNDTPAASRACPAGLLPDRIVLNAAQNPDAANWNRYRYKVFQTTVQLRNPSWGDN